MLTALFFALMAPVALASEGHDGGEGRWGETNDKVITNAGFIDHRRHPAPDPRSSR